MPANRGLGGPEWSPRPDFMGRELTLELDDSLQRYEPADVEECAAFFNAISFPDLDSYDGHPEVRASLAQETAERLLTPGVPIVQMMELYRQVEADPARRQDYEHDRQWQLMKIQKELARKQPSADGHVIQAAGRFALGSQLDLETGEVTHHVTKATPPARHLG